MENYLYAILLYGAMMLFVWLPIKAFNHYQKVRMRINNQNHRNNGNNEQTPKKDSINRRKDHSEHTGAKGLHTKRSNPPVPPTNEFEMCSITEAGDPDFKKDMPFDAWLAVVEHQSFVEYLRMDLENNGILMQDME